jgi:hypothetical protein
MIAEKTWMRKKNHKQTGQQKLATTTMIKEPPFTEKQRSRTQRSNEASTFYQGKPKTKKQNKSHWLSPSLQRTHRESVNLSLSLYSPSHKSPIKTTTIHETKEGTNRPKKEHKTKQNKTKALWWWSVAAEDAPKAPGI